jgi:hypothetical protein
MNSRERRIDPRMDTRVALQFRPLDEPGLPLESAESENISQRGIFFTTDQPLKVGMALEVSLRMPPELGGQLGSDMRCLARVVHVRAEGPDSERSGIGLHIEQFETMTAARERWVS